MRSAWLLVLRFHLLKLNQANFINHGNSSGSSSIISSVAEGGQSSHRLTDARQNIIALRNRGSKSCKYVYIKPSYIRLSLSLSLRVL